MTSASIVPMVAVAVPRITVFFSASAVEDNSVKTNTILCSVIVAGVTSVVAFGENAALSSAKYGRKTGLSSTARQNASAAQRQPFISTRRGAPYLPPTTEKPRRPRMNFCACSSRIVKSNSGIAAAAANSSLGGYWNRLQDFGVMVGEAARPRRDRRRAEQRHRLQKRDQRARNQRRQRQWNRDPPRRGPCPAAEDGGGILEFAGHVVERVRNQNEHEGERVAGDHKNDPGHRIDVEQMLVRFRARDKTIELVEQSAIRRRQ